MTDLVILSPDGAYNQVFPALLKRHHSLGIRPVSFTVKSDPFHDASGQIVDLLRPFLASHDKALVVRDLEGSGQEAIGGQALESELACDLQKNGWAVTDSAAIVLEPEIESWLRFDSVHMESLIRKFARRNKDALDVWQEKVLAFAEQHGGWIDQGKPKRPKEVFHKLLRHYGISPSNALLGSLASNEGLTYCKVPSFQRFRETMQTWFPP